MSIRKYVIIYHKLECLIKNEATGDLKSLAKTFNVSERQAANYIRDFRGLGNSIFFSKHLNSYIFDEKPQ